MIVVGFITISMWLVVFSVSIFTFIKLHGKSDVIQQVHPYQEKCIVVHDEDCRQISTELTTAEVDAVKETSSSKKAYSFDIEFEPIQLDLMLPTASQLLDY